MIVFPLDGVDGGIQQMGTGEIGRRRATAPHLHVTEVSECESASNSDFVCLDFQGPSVPY